MLALPAQYHFRSITMKGVYISWQQDDPPSLDIKHSQINFRGGKGVHGRMQVKFKSLSLPLLTNSPVCTSAWSANPY